MEDDLPFDGDGHPEAIQNGLFNGIGVLFNLADFSSFNDLVLLSVHSRVVGNDVVDA